MADINELKAIRLEKERKMTKEGVISHPERYEITHSLKNARILPDGTENVKIAGRMLI